MNYEKLLIGAKLKDINHESITVIDTKGKEYTLNFITDSGG